MTSGIGTVTPRFLKSTFAKICARVQIGSISANYQTNHPKSEKRKMMNFAISPTAMSGFRKNEGGLSAVTRQRRGPLQVASSLLPMQPPMRHGIQARLGSLRYMVPA